MDKRIITMFDRVFLTIFIMAAIRAANPIQEVNPLIAKAIMIITIITYVCILPNIKSEG